MILINNKVNNIAECNLLHDILNPFKGTKYINIHYSLFYMGVLIHIREEKNSIIFEYYWIVDVVPRLL